MGASLQKYYALRSSLCLAIFLFSISLWSLWVSYFLPLDLSVYLVLGLIILALCAYLFFRDARLMLANSCVAFCLDVGDSISLMLRDGRRQEGKLMVGGIILPFVVLINIRLEQGGHRSLVLLTDSMDADSFRHLRVLLRWRVKRQDSVSSV